MISCWRGRSAVAPSVAASWITDCTPGRCSVRRGAGTGFVIGGVTWSMGRLSGRGAARTTGRTGRRCSGGLRRGVWCGRGCRRCRGCVPSVAASFRAGSGWCVRRGAVRRGIGGCIRRRMRRGRRGRLSGGARSGGLSVSRGRAAPRKRARQAPEAPSRCAQARRLAGGSPLGARGARAGAAGVDARDDVHPAGGVAGEIVSERLLTAREIGDGVVSWHAG